MGRKYRGCDLKRRCTSCHKLSDRIPCVACRKLLNLAANRQVRGVKDEDGRQPAWVAAVMAGKFKS